MFKFRKSTRGFWRSYRRVRIIVEITRIAIFIVALIIPQTCGDLSAESHEVIKLFSIYKFLYIFEAPTILIWYVIETAILLLCGYIIYHRLVTASKFYNEMYELTGDDVLYFRVRLEVRHRERLTQCGRLKSPNIRRNGSLRGRSRSSRFSNKYRSILHCTLK